MLVKLFAAFAFANKTLLGLDRTIERKGKDYIITVHPHDDWEISSLKNHILIWHRIAARPRHAHFPSHQNG